MVGGLAATGTGAAPAGAVTGITSGGSIVFIKAFNVWLTSPDGATQRQLTTDGSATTPYLDPTESDDGSVIVAVQARPEQAGGYIRSYIYEMNRQGTLLRAPFAPDQFSAVLGGPCPVVHTIEAPQGILAAVSPDGTKIAVNPVEDKYIGSDCSPFFYGTVYVMNLDGSNESAEIQPPAGSGTRQYLSPTWLSNTRLLMYDTEDNGDHYYDLGSATALAWVVPSPDVPGDNAYRAPTVRGATFATSGFDSTITFALRLWSANGGPPAAPTPRCDVPTPDSTDIPFPRLAPDGASVIWAESNQTGTNIYISPVGNIGAGDCSAINRQLLIAGGSDPYWGPAPVGSAPPATHAVADFNGDGKTDFSVFRPSNGAWYVSGGTNAFWGTTGDIAVPGDYNGGAKTDFAVFRPSTGAWYVNGGTGAFWGTSGDIPVPGDYNGDGKTDFAAYRPSTGAWYVAGGTNGFWGGTAGDIPVPGDYNGDGKTDFAVFRPSTGAWYVNGGPNAFWGTNGDIPVPGDYNGDGKTDFAVFRPSTGGWYVAGGTSAFWGTSGDIPVPGDYNGDAKTDVAVFRPSNGVWYVQGQTAALFGTSGDVPLPLPAAIRRAFFG